MKQRDSRTLGVLVLLAGLSLAAPAMAGRPPGRAPSTDEQLAAVEREAESLEKRADALVASLTGRATREGDSERKRFNEAVYAYLAGDYDKASIGFYVVLDGAVLAGQPQEAESQWYLAECLFQARNYHAARSFFQQIVDLGTAHPFYEDSLLKLIEVQGLLGDVVGFRRLYEQHQAAATDASTPAALRIRYAMGKALYQQGDYDGARRHLADFPRGSARTLLARYFAGALVVRDGDARARAQDRPGALALYRQALAVFDEVMALPSSTEEHRKVRDLASLAQGRLRFELGDWAEAMSAYQRVPQDSESYADALYESIWTLVRQDDTSGALRVAGTFLQAFPGHVREPDVRLLTADLATRAGRYEQAGLDYQKVAIDYHTMKEQVDALLQQRLDAEGLFNTLVEQDIQANQRERTAAQGASATLPAYVAALARRDRRLDQAVDLAADIRRQESFITDSRTLLQRIQDYLVAPHADGTLAAWRPARHECRTLNAVVAQLGTRLSQIEADWDLAHGLGGAALSAARAAVPSGDGSGPAPEGSLATLDERLAAVRAEGGASSTGGVFFSRVDAARGRLRGVAGRAATSVAEVDRNEAAEVEKLKARVAQEMGVLEGAGTEATGIAVRSRGASASVAQSAFARVDEALGDLVMKADAGVADVSWYQIQALAAARNALQAEKRARKQALQGAAAVDEAGEGDR